jgi:hypothetical protein
MAIKEYDVVQSGVDHAIRCVEDAQTATIEVVKNQFDELCRSGFGPRPVQRFTHLLRGITALQACAAALYRV